MERRGVFPLVVVPRSFHRCFALLIVSPVKRLRWGDTNSLDNARFPFSFFFFFLFFFFLSPFSPPLSFSLFPPRIFLRAFPLYTRRCCTAGSLFFPLFLLLMTRARKNARGKQQRSDRHSRQRAFAGETVDSDRF